MYNIFKGKVEELLIEMRSMSGKAAICLVAIGNVSSFICMRQHGLDDGRSGMLSPCLGICSTRLKPKSQIAYCH